MTRLLRTILILTSLLSATQVYADSDDGGLFETYSDDGLFCIAGFTAGSGYANLTIPAEVSIKGISHLVTCIGGNAFRDNELITVSIPDSVTSIKANAFRNNQLISVTIGDSVTSIGDYAFAENQLTSVTIPDSVTTIEDGAFVRNLLTSVTIPGSVTRIGWDAFGDNGLTSITIPNSVKTIGAGAFSGNQLSSVTIPDSVTSIGGGAFWDNELISVSLPDSVTTIEPDAFGWNLLTYINIPNSVTSIGEGAFTFNRLSSVTIPSNVVNIGAQAFSNNQLTSITIPRSVTVIGDFAFSHNPLYSALFKANYLDSFSESMFDGGTRPLRSIAACDDTSGWEGKSFSNGWRDFSVKVIDCSSTLLVVPDIPQQSLSKIVRTDGTATDSTISIGASSDDGETSEISFNAADDLTITAKVYPDSNDVGKEGELYVVMRRTVDGKKIFFALNEDGVWEGWNASLKTLPAAKYIESLEKVEDVLVYAGTITSGELLFYVGYSRFTAGDKPVITTHLRPYKITVSQYCGQALCAVGY